jgi:hypothetical protein
VALSPPGLAASLAGLGATFANLSRPAVLTAVLGHVAAVPFALPLAPLVLEGMNIVRQCLALEPAMGRCAHSLAEAMVDGTARGLHPALEAAGFLPASTGFFPTLGTFLTNFCGLSGGLVRQESHDNQAGDGARQGKEAKASHQCIHGHSPSTKGALLVMVSMVAARFSL